MYGCMYIPIKSNSDAISIQLALVYCRIFGQDFRFFSRFLSLRPMVLGDITVHVDKYPLSGQQLVRIYSLQTRLNIPVLEEDDRNFHERKFF